jgi:hypothetical protein
MKMRPTTLKYELKKTGNSILVHKLERFSSQIGLTLKLYRRKNYVEQTK